MNNALIWIILATSSIDIGMDQNLNITSDHSVFEIRSNKGEWSGNVIATQPPYRMQADRLIVERTKSNEVQRIEAYGKPVTASGLVSGEHAEAEGMVILYDRADQKVSSSGQAKLEHGQKRITAPNIIYSFIDKNVKAKGDKKARVHMQLSPAQR